MWHIHPQQQQKGIQLAPRPTGTANKEAHAQGEPGKATARDALGNKQEGFAKPADRAADAPLKL